MRQTTKRRHEVRYFLVEKVPATILLRSLREGTTRGVPGMLVDASKNGMGVVVQEHVALESKCVIEVSVGDKIQKFRGEVCYGTRTDEGLKLGILFAKNNTASLLEFLEKMNIEVEQ